MKFVNYIKKIYWGWRQRYSLYSAARTIARIEKIIIKELHDRGDINK